MKPRLWIVTTVAESIDVLLRNQPSYLQEAYEVTLVATPSPLLAQAAAREGVQSISLGMSRRITPVRDFVSIAAFARQAHKHRPDIVQSYTPKGGLVAMVGGFLAGVDIRVHGIVGLPLMEARGPRRHILKLVERVTYSFATSLTCNSNGLRAYVNDEISPTPITVVGKGSINGVDVDYFRSTQGFEGLRQRMRIPLDGVVFVFVGRLVQDKGVNELLAAFVSLRVDNAVPFLLLVGDEEEDLDPLSHDARETIHTHPRVRRIAWTDDVRPYLGMADVFVLPSYREGLPNSLLEAGAMELPSIVSDINGCNEVIQAGVNGILVKPKDVPSLRQAMALLAEDEPLRARLGTRAREMVVTNFSQVRFQEELMRYYATLISQGRTRRDRRKGRHWLGPWIRTSGRGGSHT